MASSMMKRFVSIAAVACIVAGAGGIMADEVSYVPAAAPYEWSNETNWSTSTLPTSSDNVTVDDPVQLSSPLVLCAGASATIGSLYLGRSVAGDTETGPYNMEIFGALTNTATSYLGYRASASDPTRSASLTVKSGGEWAVTSGDLFVGEAGATSSLTAEQGSTLRVAGTLYLGRTNNSSAVVVNRGTMVFGSNLSVGGAEYRTQNWGQFDNYGNVTIGNALYIGMGPSSPSSYFYHHAGSTLTFNKNSQYTFYIGGRSTGYFIMDGDLALPWAQYICMGIYGGYTGHLVLKSAAKLTPGVEIRAGYGNNSKNYIWLNDTSRIIGNAGTINLGYAAGSKGYLTLSNESAIAWNGDICVGGPSSVSTATGYMDMWDSSAVTGGRLLVGRGGKEGWLTLHDDSHIDTNVTLYVGVNANSPGYVTLSNRASAVISPKVDVAHVVNATGTIRLTDSAQFTSTTEFYVGTYGNSTGTVELAGMSVQSNMGSCVVGVGSGAQGKIVVGDSAQLFCLGTTYFGHGGTSVGELTLNDTASAVFSGTYAWIGSKEGSTGKVTLNGHSSLSIGTVTQIGINPTSTGVVTVADNARLTIVTNTLYVGCYSGTYSHLVVTNNGVADCSSLQVGTGLGGFSRGVVTVYEGAMITNALISMGSWQNTSFGALELRGGTVLLNPELGGANRSPIGIGASGAGTMGHVCGWGKLAFAYPRADVTEAEKPAGCVVYGQVIADGQGVMRDLDMGRAGVFTYDSTSPNTCGTNGYYAVSKGRLKLPRSLPRKTSSYRCVGDLQTLASARLANSFNYTIDGGAMNGFVFSELYATDRDDIPADLPLFDGDRTMAVWRIGQFSDGPEVDEPTGPESFTMASLKFRYSLGDITNGLLRVRVLRHDGTVSGAWHQAGSARFSGTSPYVSTGTFSPSEANWNMGWFAVVGSTKHRGSLMIVR